MLTAQTVNSWNSELQTPPQPPPPPPPTHAAHTCSISSAYHHIALVSSTTICCTPRLHLPKTTLPTLQLLIHQVASNSTIGHAVVPQPRHIRSRGNAILHQQTGSTASNNIIIIMVMVAATDDDTNFYSLSLYLPVTSSSAFPISSFFSASRTLQRMQQMYRSRCQLTASCITQTSSFPPPTFFVLRPGPSTRRSPHDHPRSDAGACRCFLCCARFLTCTVFSCCRVGNACIY